MKKIIDIASNIEVVFTENNLPVMVHGREGSGASLFSITLAVSLYTSGNKLLVFTAYPMAREEFMNQIENPEKVFYLDKEENLAQALEHQCIFLESGNLELFKRVISHQEELSDRIVFIKNIETIAEPIFNYIKDFKLIISGDFDSNNTQVEFKTLSYRSKIFLSEMEGETIPSLEKYQACLKLHGEEKILTIVNS